jgi:class 3 adenylate cyclase
MHCLVHADIVDFTSWSSSLPPDTVFATVNKLYSKLDALAATVPCLYKVPPEQPTL